MRKVIRLPKSTSTPEQKAYMEILELGSSPDLQKNFMLGGPTPPAMQEENARKDKERWRGTLEIIRKYGVADHYLKPLLEKEKELAEELAEVRSSIADLEKVKPPAAVT